MMKYFLFVSLLVAAVAHSQSHRPYNGKYENGIAQYQYYFDADHEKVIDGAFSYVQNDSISFITGNFKDNKKDGNWTFINDFGGVDQMYVKTTGAYKNGLREGVWKYYRKTNTDKNLQEYASTLNFKNDSLVGTIDIEGLLGQFDDNHNFVGDWQFLAPRFNFEYLAVFRDNILVNLISQESKGKRNLGKFGINVDSILKVKNTKNQLRRASYPLNFPERKLDYTTIYCVRPDGNQTAKRLIDNFLDNIQGRFYGIQEDNNSFILLEKIKIKNPEVLVAKNATAKPTSVTGIDYEKIYDYRAVEIKPTYPGGEKEFLKYLASSINKDANMGDGKLILSFVIEKDGSLSNGKVLRGLGDNSNLEVLRVLKNCPRKWIAGEMNGKKVRVSQQIPIVIIN